MITAVNTSLVYYEHDKVVHACNSIDLKVIEGEFLGILGPSGSGKSSLLYLLSGLKLPTNGHVQFEGQKYQELSDQERGVLRLTSFGFVFQFPYLIGYLNTLENVLVGSQLKIKKDEAYHFLEILGLENKIYHFPHELSGGERQRACIARALLGNPKVIFADEPTASLDLENGVRVVEFLQKFRGDSALVMVTHDPNILRSANRVVKMSNGSIEPIQMY